MDGLMLSVWIEAVADAINVICVLVLLALLWRCCKAMKGGVW